MSRIYFHSEHGTAEVRGSERAHMGRLCGDLFNVMLGLDHDDDYDGHPSIYRGLLIPNHYLTQTRNNFISSLKTALSVCMRDVFQIKGKPVDIFSAQINTALRVGNDILKLIARLHGQCEIHCWVAGENREWLASIIERGVSAGLLRETEEWQSGWSSVVKLLRSRTDCAVVTSYSVCAWFPNAHVASWTPPVDSDGGENYDAWYDLPRDEQWRLGLIGLKQKPLLEMKPDNWESYYCGDGLDAFSIMSAARATAQAASEPGQPGSIF